MKVFITEVNKIFVYSCCYGIIIKVFPEKKATKTFLAIRKLKKKQVKRMQDMKMNKLN